MNDREARDAIIELTDEVERWQVQLMLERKAHEATRQALAEARREALVDRANLECGLANLIEPYRAEIAEALADFWEAEAARGRAMKLSWGSDQSLFEAWDGSTGDADRCWVPGSRPVPRIVWFHAHRRTR